MKRAVNILSLLLCLALMLPLISCGNTGKKESEKKEMTEIDLIKNTEPIKHFEVLDETDSALTYFALGMLTECYEKDKNILISPLSILSAMGMAQNGAEGETLSQMEAILGEQEQLNSYLASYINSLPSDENAKFHLANSVWIRDTEALSVNEDFLEIAGSYYKANAYRAAFDRETRDNINLWVKENTDGMIDSIIDEIPPSCVLYLINALAFDAKWEAPYEGNEVREREFFPEDGECFSTPFMYQSSYGYLSDEDTEGFIKYYEGEDYAFVALLPREGMTLSQYLAGLDGEKLAALFEGMSDERVLTAIPKFTVEYEIELRDIFSSLGMERAFRADAQLAPLATMENQNLFISSILHKTYISVAEKGTRAGAVTAISVDCTSAEIIDQKPKEVYLDRPFIYMIVDTKTLSPLFIGTLARP